MGAFETFVNANLGIRKPLITDSGHPSGSAKAAGVVGSHYIDSDTNFIYEKTGENNSADWVKIRSLGETVQDVVSNERPFSASLDLPTGVDTLSYSYQSIGDNTNYNSPHQGIASMRLGEDSEFFYAYSTYNVSTTGFYIAFSDQISETGNHLDISIHKD
jgi:hypothetical protein